MKSLIATLWRICLLRAGPQDLPYSPPLARTLVIVLVGLHLIAVQWLDGKDGAMTLALFSLALLLGAPWLLLSWRDRAQRYAQTISAFAGAALIFNLILLPVQLIMGDLPAPGSNVLPTGLQVASVFFMLGLLAWSLSVSGHIWRHALDWPKAGGVLLALGLFVLEIGLARLLSA